MREGIGDPLDSPVVVNIIRNADYYLFQSLDL